MENIEDHEEETEEDYEEETEEDDFEGFGEDINKHSAYWKFFF